MGVCLPPVGPEPVQDVSDELLGRGVDLVTSVGPVPVILNDHLDLGSPGPVLGELDELLIVAGHQPQHTESVMTRTRVSSPGQRMSHDHDACCPRPSLCEAVLNGWRRPQVGRKCLEDLLSRRGLLLAHVSQLNEMPTPS